MHGSRDAAIHCAPLSSHVQHDESLGAAGAQNTVVVIFTVTGWSFHGLYATRPLLSVVLFNGEAGPPFKRLKMERRP